MSSASNVTDNYIINMDKLQVADSNKDAPESIIAYLKTQAYSVMFGGGQDDKQNEEVNKDEPTPPLSNDAASLPTNTSTSSLTSTANLGNEEEKNDTPQDALVLATNNNNPTFVQLRENNDDSKSIRLCKERQLVTNYLRENKEDKDDDKQQISTSMKQLSLSNDTGLTLKGDVKNNSPFPGRGSSLYEERRNQNPTESPSQNEKLTPNRISDNSGFLGANNNEDTLALLSGNNNNNNDSASSSLDDDESFYLSGGDTVVNMDILKAEQEDLLGKYDALQTKRDERLSEEKKKVAILTERNHILHEQAIQAAKKGEDAAHLFAEIEKNEASILSLYEMNEQFFKEIEFSQEKIIHSTIRIETSIFELGRQMGKNHDEVMDGMKQGFADNAKADQMDAVMTKLVDIEAKLEKKSNSYKNPFSSRR